MNITISEIDLYDLFKAKFGEKEAKSLVSFVKTEINNQVSLSKDSLATRADLQHLENKLDYRIANSQEKMMWLIGGASTAILTVMFALFSMQTENFNKRFEASDKRFEQQNANFNQRFEAIDKKFDAINKRFEAIDKKFDEQRADFKEQMRIQTQLILEKLNNRK